MNENNNEENKAEKPEKHSLNIFNINLGILVLFHFILDLFRKEEISLLLLFYFIIGQTIINLLLWGAASNKLRKKQFLLSSWVIFMINFGVCFLHFRNH